MDLDPSELILNPDGSIYHVKLKREDIGDTIILVGDPDRVERVSSCFDEIRVKKEKREFRTHTGTLNGSELTVLSTGIGTDNIDIVMNEIDALVKIDLKTGTLTSEHKTLNFIRLGTSGALQADIPVGEMIFTAMALGIDGLESHYGFSHQNTEKAVLLALEEQQVIQQLAPLPYLVEADPWLLKKLCGHHISGITATCTGFYGPQGREILRASKFKPAIEKLKAFRFRDLRVTNFEMESSAIYLLARIFGHRALSCNIVLANRSTGAFSKDPYGDIDRMIREVLEKLTAS